MRSLKLRYQVFGLVLFFFRFLEQNNKQLKIMRIVAHRMCGESVEVI